MAVIQWDKMEDRLYDTGIDRGVMYVPGASGFPWNGLISIDEKVNSKVESSYYDGVKYIDFVTIGDFAAIVKAFTYPESIYRFEGVLEDETGVFITGQPLEIFHMSYRTKVGNPLNADLSYKIHLIYNITIIPSDREYTTLSLDTEPLEFEWTINTMPEHVPGFQPTSHIVLDTRTMDPLLVQDIEDILYGTETEDPRMPSMKGMLSFIRKWNRLIISDNGDGTWTATDNTDEYISMLDATTFEITADTAVYLNPTTYEISSSEKNEEDLWLP